jgi:putative SOS response-associated peptidase YedK
MCGRATYKLTWEGIVALYRLTMNAPPHNMRPRYNVCPTTTVDTIVSEDGERSLVPMRWGLVPGWWRKPLKELKLATFNARAETVATKPFFRGPFKRRRCLIPYRAITNGRIRRAESNPGILRHATVRRR